MKGWARALPVLVVIAAGIALGYPVALLFGLPLARQRMENLSNWTKATVLAMPLAEVPVDELPLADVPVADTAPAADRARPPAAAADARSGSAAASGLAAGATLRFADVPASSLLVRGTSPLDVAFTPVDDTVVLDGALAPPLVVWGAALEGPLDTPRGAGQVFRAATADDLALPLYLDGTLLHPGSVEALERADGRRTAFHFGADGDGPVLVGGALMREGTDVTSAGRGVTFALAPAFNAPVRRVTGDYAVLDAAGLIVLAAPSARAPRTATGTVRLAERLEGVVDGDNRVFRLQRTPLVETDRERRLFLDDRELSAEPERPEERVDGARTTFTFPGERGIVTVDGRPAVEGRDYRRAGNQIAFTTPAPRNAALRQYRDYLVDLPATGRVLLAVAPPAGADLWALSYSYYDAPTCGRTAMACFLSMSQHPVPFPHWIAQRAVPFLSSYPITDGRNVVRAVLYTATGTLWALLLGGAVGVLLAVAFVSVRPLEQALLPWVIASQTVPIIALVPVLLLILGNAGITVQTSLIPTALIGAYIAFFPVTVGTVTGLRSVDPLALDLMRSYAATPAQVFLKVRFPAAVPFLFTSLKLGAAAALVGALVAETESNNSRGLGYAIIGQVQAGDVADVWLLLIVSALLGIGLVALVGLAQRLAAPWERP